MFRKVVKSCGESDHESLFLSIDPSIKSFVNETFVQQVKIRKRQYNLTNRRSPYIPNLIS